MSDRITICFPFAGNQVGGSHISALGLLDGLDRSRYRILIVPQYADGAIARLFAGHEMIVDPALRWTDFVPGEPFGPGKFARTLRAIPGMVRFLRQHKVDIVHSNDGRTHAIWGVAARLAGARLLWHHRGDPDAMGLRYLAPLIASRIVAVSQFALSASRPGSTARRAQVIHSPFDVTVRVDRREARETLLRDTELPADTLVLAYFGNFISRKRPLAFIETVARVRDLMPDRPVAGLMFGSSDNPAMDLAMTQAIDRHGAQDIIRIMGWRSPGSFWIAACDQLVVPAIGEPFGRTLIEAMLVGTPVIATRSGGNVEALQDGVLGPLVPPDDADALAAQSVRLAQDPSLTARLSEQAKRDARNRFGEKQHVAKVSAIYEQLATG
ncbi:glycosyltransferase family 4 protein [Sphingobium aromaticiconvertens]|uniref:glycosyltransferase family 4 protein n=1 Tax=Sphingobium aromaticiconvertens TaxID=365341 RepID=UPI003015B40E